MSGSRLEATERSLTKNSGLWLNSCSTFSNSSTFEVRYIIQAEQLGSVVFVDEMHQTPMFILLLNGQYMFSRTPSANQSHVTWHLSEKFSERSTTRIKSSIFSINSALSVLSCYHKKLGTKQLHLAWFLQIMKHHGNHLLSATPCNREKVERWPNFSPRSILCRLFLAHALQIGV